MEPPEAVVPFPSLYGDLDIAGYSKEDVFLALSVAHRLEVDDIEQWRDDPELRAVVAFVPLLMFSAQNLRRLHIDHSFRYDMYYVEQILRRETLDPQEYGSSFHQLRSVQ